MLTETITLEVEADAAKVFNRAADEDKEKLQTLFESWLKQYSATDVESFKRTLDEIGANATRRGLTPEKLDSILADSNQTIPPADKKPVM